MRQHAEFLPKGFVGYRNQLAQEEIAIPPQPSLPFLNAQPENTRVFYQPGGRRNHNGRRIAGFIHNVRLEDHSRAELTWFCPDAWIKVHDVDAPPLDLHQSPGTRRATPPGNNSRFSSLSAAAQR